MPPIRTIEILSDRVVLTTPRGTREFLFSDIPQNVINRTPTEIEDWINTRLNDAARDIAVGGAGRYFYMAVRVLSVLPFSLTCTTSIAPIGVWPLGNT